MIYNVETSSYEQAYAIANTYLDAGIVPLLIGPPGIGKTSLVTRLAADRKAQLRLLRLNNIPAEEALGLQYVDDKAEKSVRLLPDWVPAADGSDGPTIVFLDEITQAPDEYRKGIMSALNERYIGSRPIPDNCWFIAAGNTIEDGTNVNDLDAATADRFGIIVMKPSLASWADNYAKENNINLAMVAFLRIRPDFFEMSDSEDSNVRNSIVKSTPRTWEKASRFLEQALASNLDEDAIIAGLSGLVGQAVALAFWQVHGEISKAPTLEDLIAMNNQELRENPIKSMNMLWAYGQSMIWHADSLEKIQKVVVLLDRLKSADGVPYAETRAQIFETIAKRARLLHKIDLIGNREIGAYQIQWNKFEKAAA